MQFSNQLVAEGCMHVGLLSTWNHKQQTNHKAPFLWTSP